MPARMWASWNESTLFLEVSADTDFPDVIGEHICWLFHFTWPYSMMALLYETVSIFEDIWIECLGDFSK